MEELPIENIIVCDDGYCMVHRDSGYDSKVCCAVCHEKDECDERCKPAKDDPSLQLCKYQQSVKMSELLSFKAKGREGLRYNVQCTGCGEILAEDEADSYEHDGDHYCEVCFYEIFDTCGYCEGTVHQEGMRYVQYMEISICESCFDDHFYCCTECGELFHMHNTGTNMDDERVCDWCWERLYTRCDNCEEGWKTEATRVTDIEDDTLCPNCWLSMVATCEVCGKTGYREDMREHGDYSSLCNECYEDESGTEESEENSEGGN